MPHAKNQNNQAVIFDFADEPVVTHAVLPKLGQRAVQCLSQAARIVELGHALTKELQDPLSVLWVEFREFAGGGLGEFNASGHGVSAHL